MAHISTVIHVVGNKHLIEVVETPTQVMKAITKQKIMEQIANIVSIESREG